MKLFTYVYKGQEQVGVMTADEKNIIPLAEKDMQTLIENWSVQKQKEIEALFKTEKGIALEQVKIKAPIPRPKQDVKKKHLEENVLKQFIFQKE